MGVRVIRSAKCSYVNESHINGMRNAIEDRDCGLRLSLADYSANWHRMSGECLWRL
jgi:hypothetical protein